MIEKWSIPFDSQQKAEGFSGLAKHQWTTFADAFSDLTRFANDLENISKKMKASDFESQMCEKLCEIWIEPPAEYFGLGWQNVKAYEEFYAILTNLTKSGYDVRHEWREFRVAMSKIWLAFPDFYKGQRIAEDASYQRLLRAFAQKKPSETPLDYEKKWAEDHKKLYEATQLPSDYDPNKPFPQYPIPADID